MSVARQSFQEFLLEVGAREKAPAVRERRREWVGALERLMTRIEGWLKEADQSGVLDVYRREVGREEPGLGRYTAPTLVIGVGNVRVEVTPGSWASRSIPFHDGGEVDGGRHVSREACGRVEVTNGSQWYSLYRVQLRHTPDGSYVGDDWVLSDPTVRATGRPGPPRLLGREQFEQVLQDLMS